MNNKEIIEFIQELTRKVSYRWGYYPNDEEIDKIDELNIIMNIHEFTSEIDYDCRFNENGCQNFQFKTDQSETAKKNMCCCSNCAGHMGYLINHDKRMLFVHMLEFAKTFDKKLGFWREGTGCILPRSIRSPVCLSYFCGSRKIDVDTSKFLYQLRSGNYYRARILMNKIKRAKINEVKTQTKRKGKDLCQTAT